MKHNRYIILFLLGISCLTNAQIVITTPYEYSVGVSAGATFSSVTFSPRIPQNKLTGATLGLTSRVNTGKTFGLQLELNFAQQGWDEKYEPDEVGENVTEMPINYVYSRNMNYIQLPFYTHVQFQLSGENVKGFINAGPQIGYMISESTHENLKGAKPGRVNIQHELAVQKKFEWGISGGGGVEIHTGIGFFSLEGRYLYALGDIYNTRSEDPFSKASGQTITVKLTYLIPVKK